MQDLSTELSLLKPNEEGDFYILFAAKEQLTTKDGKPYLRVSLRDANREVTFPIWGDSPLFASFSNEFSPGEFFKVRAFYRESNYGPQLDIRKIRPVTEEDEAEGFDKNMCLRRTRFDPEAMFNELIEILDQIEDEQVRELAQSIYRDNEAALKTLPAASYNHHAYLGGYLEHVLSVLKTSEYLANKYTEFYIESGSPIDKDLVLAGAALHDIGKLRELVEKPAGAEYTVRGTLIGHILQGRDILLEAAVNHPIDDEKLARLEHIIVSHQRLPEWGSPKPPMTPEALLVHYSDDIDAKLHIMMAALDSDETEGPMTSNRNILRQKLYRGGF